VLIPDVAVRHRATDDFGLARYTIAEAHLQTRQFRKSKSGRSRLLRIVPIDPVWTNDEPERPSCSQALRELALRSP
jgi:hypothetical protein